MQLPLVRNRHRRLRRCTVLDPTSNPCAVLSIPLPLASEAGSHPHLPVNPCPADWLLQVRRFLWLRPCDWLSAMAAMGRPAQTRAEGLRLQEWEDTNVDHADAAPFSDYPFFGRCRRPRTPSARAGRGGRPRNDYRAPPEDFQHLRRAAVRRR